MYRKLQKVRSKIIVKQMRSGKAPEKCTAPFLLEKTLDLFEWYKFGRHIK